MNQRTAVFGLLTAAILLAESCQAREPPPPAEGPVLPPRVPPIETCRDDDADCPSGSYCNRTDCWNVFDDRTKLFRPCEDDDACVESDGSKWICHRGRCRKCLRAEECARGEQAGLSCQADGRCSALPQKSTGQSPSHPAPHIQLPPPSSSGAPPLPSLPPSATAWPAPTTAPPFPETPPSDAGRPRDGSL